MRRITPLAMLAVFGVLLFAPAATASGNCQTFTNHSGRVPGSYAYADFWEDGALVVTVQTNGSGIYVNPADYQAGSKWDKVTKCSQATTTTTTTTLPEETTTTTTTLPEETTTTTTIAGSTTSAPTTSVPETIETLWTASSTCEDLAADWGEGIEEVRVYLQDPQFGEIEVDGFTEPGTLNATTGEGATWVLVPVVVNGYTAVPDQIVLETEKCEEPPTVSPTVVTTIPSGSTLPFTGPRETVTVLAASAVGLIVLGWMILKEARRED
jgi:hypothetical protein